MEFINWLGDSVSLVWNFLLWAFDVFLHLDRYLGQIISEYGTLTYVILFIIIFCETGLVVTPFLPGDSLLFAVGTFAALGVLDPVLAIILLCTAGILGDTVNYWIGHRVGPKIFSKRDSKILNYRHLDRAHKFYEKYGGKTVVIARFVPIIRTFAPFVAGIGAMTYPRFLFFNVSGAVLWVMGFICLGYFFGNLPVVKRNFSLVILAIIIISVMPGVIEFLREWRKSKRPAAPNAGTP